MKKINVIIAIAFFISLALIIDVSALENNVYNCLMGAFNGTYGSGGMILSWIISILVIILIVAGIYWLIKSASNKTNGGKK